MSVNLKSLAASLALNLGPLAPVLIFVAAASVWFAAGSINSAAAILKTAQSNNSAHTVSFERLPINDDQALSAAKRLTKLAPATVVAVSGKFVVVSITKPELFAEWVHALTEVQSISKDLQWEVEEMCIASCEGGDTAKAYVTAYRRQIKVL